MKTIVTVENKEINLNGKIFIWFNDKFLSGWGGAAGRIHKQVIICEDWTTADRVYNNLCNDPKRHGAAYIKQGRRLPNMARYSVSYRLAEDCPLWNK